MSVRFLSSFRPLAQKKRYLVTKAWATSDKVQVVVVVVVVVVAFSSRARIFGRMFHIIFPAYAFFFFLNGD